MALVTFVIPVRHQANANDWGALKARLSQTVASIAAQSNDNWRGVIVANEGADLPELPPRFSVERVSFPPNQLHDLDKADSEAVYESFRLDKGRRVLKGMLAARDARFFMIVDDDDFVSSRIVEHVSRHSQANGWKIDRGYLWSEGGKLMLQHDDFSNYCGTSLIIRAAHYGLPEQFSDAGDDYVKSMLGSHVRIGAILADRGVPLEKLPFRGAVYRVGHSGAHSKSPPLWRVLFRRSLLLRPGRFFSELKRFRCLSKELRQEFFGRKSSAS
jgi:hypothetical protein